MSFYLKPPRGFMHLFLLEECVKERLKFYSDIENSRESLNFQRITEDSALDRTGHYMFRLTAFRDKSFREIFIKTEIKLLMQRLRSYRYQDVRYFLKCLQRQCKEKELCVQEGLSRKMRHFYSVLHNICSTMLKKHYSNHVFRKMGCRTNVKNKDFKLCQLKVPFYFCCSLVRNRTVELKQGNALIPCNLWKEFICSLFETYLNYCFHEEVYSAGVQLALQDERMSDLTKEITMKWSTDRVSNCQNQLSLSNLSEESIKFPLCMRNLFVTLKENHRLAHEDRFTLSLYLKDIGLSLDDSISFWKDEYMKEHSSCSKCTHSWTENEKKYIYSIRHLYGLEGSRKNYAARSCQQLQAKILGVNEKGGCPFKHCDDTNLRKLLKELNNFESQAENIVIDRRANPQRSCSQYCAMTLERGNSSSLNEFSSPTEFYRISKALNL